MSLFRLRAQLGLGAFLLFTTCHVATGDRHETPAEFLKRHGIEVTEKGLVAALKNSDPQIRDSAAQELAEEKAAAALPALKDALSAEKDPEMQVNLAEALARLGDKGGFVALKHFCDTLSPSPRLKAALYMLRFGDESCLNAVKSVLQSEPKGDHLYVATAMSLIPSFHNLGTSDKTELFVLTVKQLADPTPYIRLTASQVLGKMEDIDVIPSLEKAIADETDQVVRSSMQAELEKLKAKENH
jgi:HEAT repeat protein